MTCNIVVNINGEERTLTETMTYKKSATPLITKIDPSFGSSYGGTVFTITGDNFGASSDVASVIIDNTVGTCEIKSNTEIECTTAKRSKIGPNTFKLKVTKVGETEQYAFNKFHTIFTYLDRLFIKVYCYL